MSERMAAQRRRAGTERAGGWGPGKAGTGLAPGALQQAMAASGSAVGLRQLAHHVFNPLQSMKDDAAFGEQMMKGIIKPYQQENSQGKYAEAAGRGVFDIGSIILTEGAGAGVEGAANVARGAEVAGDATKGFEVTANIAKTEEVVADVSKGREAVTDTSKMSGADQAANVVNGTGGGRMELRPFP